MFIKGLVKGLSITFVKFFKKKVTESYPDVMPALPERTRSSFEFYPEKCISCNLCAMACPNSVIKVESHKDEKGAKVLDNYKMSLGYCLYCGLCVEACPKDAITFNTKFENAVFHREDCCVNWKGVPKAEEPAKETPAGEASVKETPVKAAPVKETAAAEAKAE